MKNRDIIRQMHTEAPPRPADDPLREFMSLVVLRDHARTMKLTLRKLHQDEKVKDGDLTPMTGDGGLMRIRVRWWQRSYRAVFRDYYRIE